MASRSGGVVVVGWSEVKVGRETLRTPTAASQGDGGGPGGPGFRVRFRPNTEGVCTEAGFESWQPDCGSSTLGSIPTPHIEVAKVVIRDYHSAQPEQVLPNTICPLSIYGGVNCCQGWRASAGRCSERVQLRWRSGQRFRRLRLQPEPK